MNPVLFLQQSDSSFNHVAASQSEGKKNFHPETSHPSDLESQDDDLSEMEIMSGVYPMHDESCSERDIDEVGDNYQELQEEGESENPESVPSEEESDNDSNKSNATVIEGKQNAGGDKVKRWLCHWVCSKLQ